MDGWRCGAFGEEVSGGSRGLEEDILLAVCIPGNFGMSDQLKVSKDLFASMCAHKTNEIFS